MQKLLAIIRTVLNPQASLDAYERRVAPVSDAMNDLRDSAKGLQKTARSYSATLLRNHRAEKVAQQQRH